jgi:nicotinamide-nucleotide amidase
MDHVNGSISDLQLPPLSTAAIVAVGSELLTPFRSDTNSLAITARLDEIGVRVVLKCVVGDSIDDITRAIAAGAARAGLVIISGGLGPTSDDLTREAVAAFAGVPLREDARLVDDIAARFARRGVAMPAINRKQALVPDGGEPIANPNGSAPGLVFERPGVTIVALPGPPRELVPMLDALVDSHLRARASGTPLSRRVLKISGRGESAVDEVAAPIYQPYERAAFPVETTILAAPGLVELHLQCRSADVDGARAQLAELSDKLAAALGPACYSTEGASPEEAVGAILRARGLWIAAAESCTAGLITARLTEVPGSSSYVRGGIVAYDNDIKRTLLDVPDALLKEHGAVSEPVARAMADGARARLGADVAVAVTGIAGPSGGTAEKPVGTVVIAATGLDRARVRTFRFNGDRHLVRAQSVHAALEAARRLLLDL